MSKEKPNVLVHWEKFFLNHSAKNRGLARFLKHVDNCT